jgi:hypothetical protein
MLKEQLHEAASPDISRVTAAADSDGQSRDRGAIPHGQGASLPRTVRMKERNTNRISKRLQINWKSSIGSRRSALRAGCTHQTQGAGRQAAFPSHKVLVGT